jgi:LAS superfamily LD-carboxypeptidase LdcB
MKTFFVGIIAFLAATLRVSPELAKSITIKNNNDSIISFNQQITEYTLDTEVKPTETPKTITVVQSNWWDYPADMKPATRSGDDLLVLVNKEYTLPEDYVPSDLVSASLSGLRLGEGFMLRNILIDDLKNMVNDAKSDGVDLSIVSGYRSYQDQIDTYNYWTAVNGNNTDIADQISARPGHSQHQLGTAIDFSTSEVADGLTGQFTNTKASKWLYANSWKYGFVISYPQGFEGLTGYDYESWHYRYIGIDNAKEMHDSGMILEVYLESKNQ